MMSLRVSIDEDDYYLNKSDSKIKKSELIIPSIEIMMRMLPKNARKVSPGSGAAGYIVKVASGLRGTRVVHDTSAVCLAESTSISAVLRGCGRSG